MIAVKELPSAEVDATAYTEAVKSLTGSMGNVPVRIVWALLFTPMETSSAIGVKAENRVMPAWMESCWRDLPLSMLPEVSFNGLDWVNQELRDKIPEAQAGTGLIIEALGKAIFAGFGEVAGFCRISRPAYVRVDHGWSLDEDWCQQTRLLYRNRTSLELKRILILGPNIPEVPLPEQCSLETVAATWTGDQAEIRASNVQDSIRYLHSCLLSASARNEASGLADPLLNYRKSKQMSSALKAGVSLMVCGWLLLFLGACQNFNYRTGQNPELLKRWNQERAIWEESNKEYRKHMADLSRDNAPYHMVAVIAGGIPQNLEIDRIQISERANKAESVHAITLEGRIADGDTDGEFRQWIESLKQELRSNREELKLLPKESGLRFQYLSEVPFGGIDQ